MQILSVKKGFLIPEIELPSSKSYANRAIIIAALLKQNFALDNLPKATDVTILLDCLRKIGLTMDWRKKTLLVTNSFPDCELAGCDLDVGEGGTTARFLATMLLLGRKTYRLHLGERLKNRPWNEFLTVARSLGAEAELRGNILSLKGPITLPDTLEIDCSQTTQFATAFQLISIIGKTKVTPLNLNSSRSYWLMTEELMKKMSLENKYTIALDWSCASYPLAFGALNQEIYFPGLREDIFQADSKILKILKRYDALSSIAEDGIRVKVGHKSGSLVFDVSDALDLVPTLAFYLAHIEGHHKLTGIENLVHKESDRLGEIIKLLARFSRKATSDGQSLYIEGSDGKIEGPVDLIMPNDHRMVMVASLFLLHHSGGSVQPAEAVAKSYPDFFKILALN